MVLFGWNGKRTLVDALKCITDGRNATKDMGNVATGFLTYLRKMR